MTARTLSLVSAAALAVALASPAHAGGRIAAPDVPPGITVPEGNHAFFVGHAIGTQNYVCLPSASGVAWKLFTPEATLFDDDGQQLTTHFFSPNPEEGGTVRPTWQHSRDTSAVWAALAAPASSHPDYVASDAIPWLLLQVKGADTGPDHTDDALTGATYVHRVNTVGGLAPSTGCASSSDVGASAYVPYEADYYFYTADQAH